jgi:hypothetical protein
LKIETNNYSAKVERATGIEPVLPAWEGKYSALYFQQLQNRSAETYVHALHTVHALPDLRIAGGRLGDGFYHALLFATADLRLLFCDEASRYSRFVVPN